MNNGEKAMALCVGDDRMETLDVMVRCWSIIDGGFRRLNFFPHLANFPPKRAFPLFPGMGIEAPDMPRLRRVPGSRRYIIICGGGDAPNLDCNRYLSREIRQIPTSFPITRPRFGRIFSGSVRYGRPVISYVDLPTIAHFSDAKDFSAMEGVVSRLFEIPDKVQPVCNIEESIALLAAYG